MLLELLGACEDLHEVVVCDGGSRDLTTTIVAAHPGVQLLQAPAGRARQMNHGALAATGDVLWFLHADCQPPPDAAPRIRAALAEPDVALGAFRFAVDSPRLVFRYLEAGVRTRSEWLGVPYGDQGLFLRRDDFLAWGGYPEVPRMEDLYLVRAARRRGAVRVVPPALPCSPRRWEAHGFWRTSARNWVLVVADWLGLTPEPEPSAAVLRTARP